MHDRALARMTAQLAAMPVVPLRWRPALRIVPRYPPIEQLEQFDSELQAAVLAELASVDPTAVGNIRLLPPGRVPAGKGASRIITSYTFSRPGRFNDDGLAAFYGAESLETAIAETVFHVVLALRDSNAPPQRLPPRLVLCVDVEATGVVEARLAVYEEIYDRDSYAESRRFGALIHERGHEGIVYRSVRRPDGECIAIFAPDVLGNCREDRELIYYYDGGRIEVSEVHYESDV